MRNIEKIESPLFQLLSELSIPIKIYRHAPLSTVKESKDLRGNIPGTQIKNLFLRDKKKNKFLFVLTEDETVDLKDLKKIIGCSGNLSFGNKDLLFDCLGVEPGSVTPFAAINDITLSTKIVIDRKILDGEIVNAHPLHNQATISISGNDLRRFLEECKHSPYIIDLI